MVAQVSLGMGAKFQAQRDKEAFWAWLLVVAVSFLSFLPTHDDFPLWEKGVSGL